MTPFRLDPFAAMMIESESEREGETVRNCVRLSRYAECAPFQPPHEGFDTPPESSGPALSQTRPTLQLYPNSSGDIGVAGEEATSPGQVASGGSTGVGTEAAVQERLG